MEELTMAWDDRESDYEGYLRNGEISAWRERDERASYSEPALSYDFS